MREMLVKDLMTTSVATLQREQSLPLAKELMRLKRIRHVPVIDGEDHLVGLLTHRDLLGAQVSALSQLAERDREELQLCIPVAKIMRADVWTVAPDTPALEAARIMLDHGFGCLPVVRERKLVGILTEADFLRLLVEVFERDRQHKRGSESTPEQLSEELSELEAELVTTNQSK